MTKNDFALFPTLQSQDHKPLAESLRPKDYADFVGQEHLMGANGKLRRLIESGKLPSIILWGPPGVGKTTVALLIAEKTNHHFETLSAVTSGIKEVKAVIEQARARLQLNDKRTILFVDEIHRFNKAQQDAFLPHVESGVIIFIGATTENPSFEVNSALLSRCQVFTLNALSEQNLISILERAQQKLNRPDFLSPKACELLARSSHGDARYLLNALQDLHALIAEPQSATDEQITELLANRSSHYDKKGEHHYNVISAFIKSMRGSDPDAALYYLARMLDAGEDPRFIARRMMIFASEDVGMANPQAVSMALSCAQVFERVGDAEGWIPLAHCATYLAVSPKSNSSYAGYKKALDDVKQHGALEVPLHLRNAPTKLMKNMGYGKGYQYAHDHPGAEIDQQHLPDKVKNQSYYSPSQNGAEKKIYDWLHSKKSLPND
ncbi:MAG: replication-associated recombination protein A [Deltaproteobacteria bacterium]|nr:replication-associated recombination protein A [Deltaproteobacteria bacterium]